MVATTTENDNRQQVLKLIEEKDKIEKKISEFGDVLRKVRNLFKNQYYYLIIQFFRIKSASPSHLLMLRVFQDLTLTYDPFELLEIT